MVGPAAALGQCRGLWTPAARTGSGEEVGHAECHVGESERRQRLTRTMLRHARVAISAGSPVDLDEGLRRQEKPELRNTRARVKTSLDEPVEADRRIGHF